MQQDRNESIFPLGLFPFTLSKSALCLSGYIKLEVVYCIWESRLLSEHMALQIQLISLLLKLYISLTFETCHYCLFSLLLCQFSLGERYSLGIRNVDNHRSFSPLDFIYGSSKIDSRWQPLRPLGFQDCEQTLSLQALTLYFHFYREPEIVKNYLE